MTLNMACKKYISSVKITKIFYPKCDLCELFGTDPGFSLGATTSTYCSTKFSWKLHENETIGPGGATDNLVRLKLCSHHAKAKATS